MVKEKLFQAYPRLQNNQWHYSISNVEALLLSLKQQDYSVCNPAFVFGGELSERSRKARVWEQRVDLTCGSGEKMYVHGSP